MKQKTGFTLIELLVVIVIIGILVAIALPNYIRVKQLAREAEAKNNLHSIQLSLERYATDTEGYYPSFLYGGDAMYSQPVTGTYLGPRGCIIQFNVGGSCPAQRHVFDFYDAFYEGGTDLPVRNGFDDESVTEQYSIAFNDTIVFNGYLSKYPANPFAGNNSEEWFGKAAAGTIQTYAGWGGKDGDLMFNLGAYGEVPGTVGFRQNGDPDAIRLDFPGAFYYHPRFADRGTPMEHGGELNDSRNAAHIRYWSNEIIFQIQGRTAETDPRYTENMTNHDVNGYDLAVFGAETRGNQDVDWSYGIGAGESASNNAGRSGYFVNSQQRSPWGVDEDGNRDYSIWSEADGISDFIATVLSSGIDTKVSQ